MLQDQMMINKKHRENPTTDLVLNPLTSFTPYFSKIFLGVLTQQHNKLHDIISKRPENLIRLVIGVYLQEKVIKR